MQIKILLYILFLVPTTFIAQEKFKVPANVVFHKMASFENTYWAFDYGSGRIYKADYGPQRWVLQAQLGSEYFEKIQFLDGQNGFVCGDYGYVYKTQDGGSTWTEISPKIDGRIRKHFDRADDQKPSGFFVAYYDMHFHDQLSGFIWGYQYEPAGDFRETHQSFFFVTDDGGESWDKLENNKTSRKLVHEYFYSKIEDKSFKNLSNNFYLNNQKVFTGNFKDGKHMISVSIDGGSTWEDKLLPEVKAPRWMIRKVLFKNDFEGFIFGGTLQEEPMKSVVFKTSDGGITWGRIHRDWPHIHDALLKNGHILVSGKDGFLRGL